MKKLLFVLLFVLLSISGFTQNGWSANNYYAYQGQTYQEYGQMYQKYDGWGNYIGMYALCRTMKWEQQWYSGSVYLWNASTGQWYYEWREGTYWYCWWSPYYEVYYGM